MNESMFDDALRVRDNAIARTEHHAGPEWRDQALAWLRGYLETHHELPPDAASRYGCPEPPDGEWRAMGSIYRRAARDGWMEKCGAAPRASGHLTWAPVWRSRIYKAAVA